MNDHFLNLATENQAALIKSSENVIGLIDTVIEKDLWLCRLMEIIFSMPVKMVFKGGTSLSKVYNLIDRFSEDVDITVDYRFFRDSIDMFTISRSQLKKISRELKDLLSEFINEEVAPFIQSEIKVSHPDIEFQIEVDNNGEQIRFYYPSVLNTNYLRDHVLLEFGIRNEIEPQEEHMLYPYLADSLEDKFILPKPTIATLSPLRTFWEKATLIHVECHRQKLQQTPERLSRHWYDLFRLNTSWVGEKALDDKELLNSVVIHKKAFFNSSYANYDKCLQGEFHLIPDETSLNGLEDDYKRMLNAGMFVAEPPEFNDLIESLHKLESEMNLKNKL